MKILLIGEFSGFFSTLKSALNSIGYEVTLASTGDSWRKFQNDIHLIPRWGNETLENLHRYLLPAINQKKLFGYDVVQLINPAILSPVNPFNAMLGRKIIESSGKTFLSACGDDSYYFDSRKNLRYNPLDDAKDIDYKGKKLSIEYEWYKSWNRELAKKANGVIPVMYDYAQAYRNINGINLRKSIPLPVNLKKLKYIGSNNSKSKKLTVFHGLNREGYKGTKYVREAFNILQEKYTSKIDFIIGGQIPYTHYINYLAQFDIVVDQVNSYSSGMNGIIAMALGKVVVGGAEPESMNEFGLNKSPVINITPNTQDIVDKLTTLIENKINLESIGWESRQFVENNHDSVEIAKKYVQQWNL